MIAKSKRGSPATGRSRALAGAIASVAMLTACGDVTEGGDEPITTIKAPVVFGTDDRVETSPVQNPRYRDLANATAALMSDVNMTISAGTYRFMPLEGPFMDGETPTANANNFGPPFSRPLCANVYARGQARRAECTAFLIGPDLFATAGHCLKCTPNGACEVPNRRVVFNFDPAHTDPGGTVIVPVDDVYVVTGTPAGAYTGSPGTPDWAIFRVDRPVKGHAPLTPQFSGTGTSKGELATAGHPDKVPLKLARAGWAKVDNPSNAINFFTSLDLFGGNSGSPIVDFETGVVLGLHARPPYMHYVDAPDGSGGLCATPTICSTTTGCSPTFGESPWSIETRMTLALAGAQIRLPPAQIIAAVF